MIRTPDYGADLNGIVRRILVDHKVAVRGKRVLLKPNLVEFSSGTPVNTSAVFVAAVYEAFRSLGASEVWIAEGPGHRRITMDLADSAGFFHAMSDFERRFVDLNLDEVSRVKLRRPFSTLDGTLSAADGVGVRSAGVAAETQDASLGRAPRWR